MKPRRSPMTGNSSVSGYVNALPAACRKDFNLFLAISSVPRSLICTSTVLRVISIFAEQSGAVASNMARANASGSFSRNSSLLSRTQASASSKHIMNFFLHSGSGVGWAARCNGRLTHFLTARVGSTGPLKTHHQPCFLGLMVWARRFGWGGAPNNFFDDVGAGS